MEILKNNSPGPDVLIITKLSPAVKNPNRVNIFVNDKYSFSLDLSQVVDFKIKVGQILTKSKISEYQHASEFGKLYQRTLEWVLIRPRSIKEVKDHLETKRYRRISENNLANKIQSQKTKEDKKLDQKYHRKTPKALPVFEPEDIENIIHRLISKGYLDDQKFAEFYIENRFVKKGISQKRLKLELTKKGISQDLIDQALSQNLRNDSSEIQKIIIKKQNKYTPEKLIAYLVRQGFDYQLSQAAVLEMDSQNQAQNL